MGETISIDDGDLGKLRAVLARARPGDVVLFRGEVPYERRRVRVADVVAAGGERPIGPKGALPDEAFVERCVRPAGLEKPAGVNFVQKAPLPRPQGR